MSIATRLLVGIGALAVISVLFWLLIKAWQYLALHEADAPRYFLLKLAWRLILLAPMSALASAGISVIIWVCGAAP